VGANEPAARGLCFSIEDAEHIYEAKESAWRPILRQPTRTPDFTNELWPSRSLLLDQIFRAQHELDVSLSVHAYCLVEIHGLEGDHFLLSI
jgi:hypothetical protein